MGGYKYLNGLKVADTWYFKNLDVAVESVWGKKESGRFPDDQEFSTALSEKQVYLMRGHYKNYLFERFENYGTIETKDVYTHLDNNVYSIEHIMPQTLNAQWKVYLSKKTMEEYEALLHRLGNLALTNYNGEMSNKSFDEKKSVYKNTNYHYTKEIADYDQWQIKEIDDRSEMMAKKALKIWTLPPQYQQAKAAPKSLHAIGEDTSQFAYTKPSQLMIGDSEYPVSYWADFLPLLCQVLDKEDHKIFIDIARSGKISAFAIEDDEHDYANNSSFWHVQDDLYIRQFMSASSILDTVFKVAKAFDDAAGTDYSSNILFTLK